MSNILSEHQTSFNECLSKTETNLSIVQGLEDEIENTQSALAGFMSNISRIISFFRNYFNIIN